MKSRLPIKEIRKILRLKRVRHSHVVSKLHLKHKVSYRTLFYMKEYGPKSHVTMVIVKESIKVLLLASFLSSIGGVALKGVEEQITTFIPLLILLPALATMIGSFGTVVAFKFTTLLLTTKVPAKWWHSNDVMDIIYSILIIALISSVYIGVLAYAISIFSGFVFDTLLMAKILATSLIATFVLVGIILLISITFSLWIFHKREDPSNFVIPITTSVADLGSILLFSVLVVMLF